MRITLKVVPRASKQVVEKVSTHEYKVRVFVAPEKGKANDVVTELIAEYFGVAKSAVRIVRGATARTKLVEVDCDE